MTANEAFLRARDFLVEHREDYPGALRGFQWPVLDHFNWALDHFDVYATGNERPALWIVEEGGAETKVSFQELSARSNQVANALRALGLRRGDGVLVMLDNVLPLWEIMLDCIKLGAVLVPSTLLLSQADLEDRIERGGIRHLVVDATQTGKFEGMAPGLTRISVGGEVAGWRRWLPIGLVGFVVLAAFISPYREDRDRVRALFGPDEFIEIYLNCPLATCEERDPKGLYKKARAGELPDFTGIDSPYQEPLDPELILDTGATGVRESVRRITRYLKQHVARREGVSLAAQAGEGA